MIKYFITCFSPINFRISTSIVKVIDLDDVIEEIANNFNASKDEVHLFAVSALDGLFNHVTV